MPRENFVLYVWNEGGVWQGVVSEGEEPPVWARKELNGDFCGRKALIDAAEKAGFREVPIQDVDRITDVPFFRKALVRSHKHLH